MTEAPRPRSINLFADFTCPFSYVTEAALWRLSEQQPLTLHARAFELFPAPEPTPHPAQDPAALELSLDGLANDHYAALPTPWFKIVHGLPLGHCEGPDHLARIRRLIGLREEVGERAVEGAHLHADVDERLAGVRLPVVHRGGEWDRHCEGDERQRQGFLGRALHEKRAESIGL